MITLTKQAAEHVKRKLTERGHGIGIKVGVKPSGCSGFSYVMEYVDSQSVLCPLSFDSFGVTIFVDLRDVTSLQGTVIDYVKCGLNEGFEFRNPQETSRCGCGGSFST